MINTEFDYEQDLLINPDELDIAALGQANLCMKYSKELAWYERNVKQKHEKIKTLRAELIKEATENPDEFLGKGIKATATNVEAYYRNDENYKQAKQEWIEAEYERDIIKAASDHIAFQRKAMIQTLSQLLQQEYFASPTIPRDLKKKWEDKKENDMKEPIANTAANIKPRRRNQ